MIFPHFPQNTKHVSWSYLSLIPWKHGARVQMVPFRSIQIHQDGLIHGVRETIPVAIYIIG